MATNDMLIIAYTALLMHAVPFGLKILSRLIIILILHMLKKNVSYSFFLAASDSLTWAMWKALKLL